MLRGELLKGRSDHRPILPAAHQILGDPLPQDAVDGVDQDGFSRAGLPGKDVQTLGQLNGGL